MKSTEREFEKKNGGVGELAPVDRGYGFVSSVMEGTEVVQVSFSGVAGADKEIPAAGCEG